MIEFAACFRSLDGAARTGGTRMAFDQDLAASVRTALAGAGAIREVKMFGGIGFMLNRKMVAAASARGLLVRVGKDRQDDALAQEGAGPMVMRGRWSCRE